MAVCGTVKLEGEMDSHMTDCSETGIVNRRNDKTTKTIKSTTGVFDLERLETGMVVLGMR